MIKAGMVSFGEGDYKLSSSLVARMYPDPSLCQSLRVHECDKLEQEIWLRFEQVGCLAPDSRFKLLCISTRYTIPRFCFTPMH